MVHITFPAIYWLHSVLFNISLYCVLRPVCCVLFYLLRFPYSIPHIVERLGDRFQVSHCVLKTDRKFMVSDIAFDLLYPFDRFDSPTGSRGCAASDNSRYWQCVAHNSGLGCYSHAKQHYC